MARSSQRTALAALVVAAAVLLALSAPASAQVEAGEEMLYGFNVSFSLGGVLPTTDEYGNALLLRLAGGYELSPNLALALGIGTFSSAIDHGLDTPPENTLADGELKIMPLTLSLQLRYPVPEMYGTVYGLAGIGYYFMDYSWSGGSREYFSQVEALYGPGTQDVSDAVGFHLGGGFDYPLNANVFLNLEGQYLVLSPDASGAWRDLVTGERQQFGGDIDLNSWIFSAGVKYVF